MLKYLNFFKSRLTWYRNFSLKSFDEVLDLLDHIFIIHIRTFHKKDIFSMNNRSEEFIIIIMTIDMIIANY